MHRLEETLSRHDTPRLALLFLDLDVSIGIALYPDDASNPRELLKHTDIAMYEAKRSGRGYRLFDAWMGATLVSRLAMTRRLSGAIEQEGLTRHWLT
ncbi:diguanylate cyclase domain-containing protein [Halomonas sp.]|uniref:diguanylate cyclase domain-containing protein n=1 Tax=Halomonas sp. TaxID=1486246 RepID=UPI0035690AA5